MAKENASAERSQPFEEQLGFGSYVKKQIRGITISAVGFGGGAGIGHQLGKMLDKPNLHIQMGEGLRYRMPAWGVGAALGGVVSTLFQGYEHWVKVESSRLAVNEINEDIANAKIRTNPDLLRENRVLRSMLEKMDDQTPDASVREVRHEAGLQSTVMEPQR